LAQRLEEQEQDHRFLRRLVQDPSVRVTQLQIILLVAG
jgi:hypothetical protein